MRCERCSPPYGFALVCHSVRHSLTKRTGLARRDSNLSAARRDRLPSTAWRSLIRKPSGKGLAKHAGPLLPRRANQILQSLVICPSDSVRSNLALVVELGQSARRRPPRRHLASQNHCKTRDYAAFLQVLHLLCGFSARAVFMSENKCSVAFSIPSGQNTTRRDNDE